MLKKKKKTNPEPTEVLEFADKDIKTVVITVFPMFKMLCRNMEKFKKN